MAANEASAVGSSRTVNVAQVTYAATYHSEVLRGNLAKLASDPRGGKAESPEHAGLLDQSLANASCAGDAWCTKSGYRFRITTVCKQMAMQGIYGGGYSGGQQHRNKKVFVRLLTG